MDPLALFNEFVSKNVRIHTSDRSTYTGCLLGFDIYVNVTLQGAQLADSEGEKNGVMQTCIINGLNITFIEVM